MRQNLENRSLEPYGVGAEDGDRKAQPYGSVGRLAVLAIGRQRPAGTTGRARCPSSHSVAWSSHTVIVHLAYSGVKAFDIKKPL